MPHEIWVAGYPSTLGGADTELDHNIDLWRSRGVEVHLVPMFGATDDMRRRCDERGCHTHEYRSDIFADKRVASWCNGQFLELLPEIMREGPPASVTWFNCMTWTFPREVEAHSKGWIDRFGFVSRYQEGLLRPQLEQSGPVRSVPGYRPFFSLPEQRPAPRPVDGYFAIGRLSRDDAQKYPHDLWQTFVKVLSPRPLKFFVMGWGPNALQRCGSPPETGLDWMTMGECYEPVERFYARLHCIIHKTGGSRESYCRIVPEAYAHSVPVIVEDDYAFPELVIDGETGFRCADSTEMAFRASQLAYDEALRRRIVDNAWEHLCSVIADADTCWEPWERWLSETEGAPA